MDFITGLPPSRGSSAIMVVVDRLTKYAHFGALPTGFDAHRVALLFVDIVIKHHGFPSSIVSDRDPIFVSKFWSEVFRLSGTTLKCSTAYHLQTDGQSEVMNWGLEQYLRAFTHERPSRWTVLLPWAEYSLNISYHASIKMAPFQALYGRPPPSIIPYQPRASYLLSMICFRSVTLSFVNCATIYAVLNSGCKQPWIAIVVICLSMLATWYS